MTDRDRRALRKLINEQPPTTRDKQNFIAMIVPLLNDVRRTSLALAKALEEGEASCSRT